MKLALSMLNLQSPETGYGSDHNGLVWGFRFRPGSAPEPINCDAALPVLSQLRGATAQPGDTGFVWLHLSLSNGASERWMRQNLTLPGSFYDSLHDGTGSTRLEVEGDALIAVLHDVLFNTAFDSANVATVTLHLEPHLVVSTRLRPLRAVDQLRVAVRNGQALRSAAELLAQLLRDQAEVLADIVRKTTGRLDAIEDSMLANRISASRSELSGLRRSLVRLQRLLAPEPAALFRLLNRPPDWLSVEDVQDLRQSAEEFSAAVADSGVLVERLKLLQEELSATVEEHTNRTLFILTLVTVLALPINVVTGLFGMNVGGMPLAQHGSGFFIIVISLVIVTGLLAYFLLIRRRD
jgi:zinc transporter